MLPKNTLDERKAEKNNIVSGSVLYFVSDGELYIYLKASWHDSRTIAK